ncbi:unnamed protein product [Bursaphelenchus xylophilus]|uniref:Hydroxymethylglutaryl-CoA synthase n=1 Tax=Bursaphelenchus xylophilus TaxID=6326 RepID=A0A7I8XAC0_BURXY|nr:unnamed protein product [Bursaphelenchus xylophilus]CAG9132266.1 unnamed protein product [Bursaphelenchus xylophilus]
MEPGRARSLLWPQHTMSSAAPKNVGIQALEFYFPRRYIEQTAFEKFNGESEGKYTIGLGLKQMGYCDNNEDINSICLTATAKLLERYNVDPLNVGYLVVGTETTIDKSKSVKTSLMELFSANPNIEGVDIKNGCYGGTQALFHAVDWVYSNWETDGRLAIVVSADIAAYAPGPARCTGGAGAMAFLVGPNAPLALERGLRTFHMSNVYDFYKPCKGINSEFPLVDGNLSMVAYLSSVDESYKRYKERHETLHGTTPKAQDFAAIIMHCPFYKLVQKGLARIYYQDAIGGLETGEPATALLKARGELSTNQTYFDKNFLSTAAKSSKELLNSKVAPNITFNQRIGNMYTPSMYAQLVAFLARTAPAESLNGQRILAFSYGSGSAAAMYSIKLNVNHDNGKEMYRRIYECATEAVKRLEDRILTTPEEYTEAMSRRQALAEAEKGTTPVKPDQLFPGTFYLTEVDDLHRRFYNRTE